MYLRCRGLVVYHLSGNDVRPRLTGGPRSPPNGLVLTAPPRAPAGGRCRSCAPPARDSCKRPGKRGETRQSPLDFHGSFTHGVGPSQEEPAFLLSFFFFWRPRRRSTGAPGYLRSWHRIHSSGPSPRSGYIYDNKSGAGLLTQELGYPEGSAEGASSSASAPISLGCGDIAHLPKEMERRGQ
jgi:hypothetical protein